MPDTIPWIREPERARMRQPRRKHGLADIDSHVGARLRLCRTAQGLSLQQLSERVGIPYQQTHKYERAHSRIPAGMLAAFAEALNVTPGRFFGGAQKGEDPGMTRKQRQYLELSRSFAAIGNPRLVDAFVLMARILADEVAKPGDEEPIDALPPGHRASLS